LPIKRKDGILFIGSVKVNPHCFLLQKIENRYATALAGHRAAILFNFKGMILHD